MESKLSPKNIKIVSNTIISLFAAVALISFLFTIDRTAIVTVISSAMLFAGLYMVWFMEEFDSASLLIFFFGTTACFYFFSDVIGENWPKALAVVIFALLSLVLSNYLLNLVKPLQNPEKAIYKITLAIIFTEIFWVLSFFVASPISKGAITAVIFFNLQSLVADLLSRNFKPKRFTFLLIASILLLGIIIYRI